MREYKENINNTNTNNIRNNSAESKLFVKTTEINTLEVNEDFVPVEHIFIESVIVLEVGGTTQISVRVEPENATNTTLRYVSLTPNIVSVDEATGLVTALAEGNATVEIQATDGSGVTNELWGVVHAPIGVPAIRAISDCFIRTDTVINNNTILKSASGENVILRASSNDCIPLVETEKISVDNTDWYKVMYNGMVAYVTADSFIETTNARSRSYWSTRYSYQYKQY